MGRGRPKKRRPTPSESSEDEDFMLPAGADVEVRSDDPGFVGSFYEATVAGHLLSSGGRGCYTVVYSTLVGDDEEPLRETADAADVRPRPPPEKQREFAIHEMVEAFHNEGWWAGVVAAIFPPPVTPSPRAYRVTFPTSRETLQFKETDLRPHRVFQCGRWVPAAEVGKGSPLFSQGDQVEVSQSATNFGECWSPATVLKVIGATHFLVQYMHVRKDEESATEIVDSQYIRPKRVITARRMDSKYKFSQASHVEVLHEGGWRPGTILEVLESEIDTKYVVNLKNRKADMDNVDPVDVLTVQNTQLRPRFEWDGKKWVQCLKKHSHQKYVHQMHPFQKSSNGPQSTSRKRPVSTFYDDSDKVSNKPGSRRDKKLKNEDVISKKISPVLSTRNENNEIAHKQRKTVLALRSGLSLPSLPPMAAFGSLCSSSLAPSCPLDQSSSQMSIRPSMPQSRQLQASLFGAFGQPRPVPQSPVLGTPSLNSNFRSNEGSKNALIDQDKQSTVGTVPQMEECLSSQTAVALWANPETPMKEMAAPAKATEEDNNIISISENLAELPNDVTAGCETLPKVNVVSCIAPTPRKDIGGAQEGGHGRDDVEQGGYAGEAHDSCRPLSPESVAVHESIMDTNGQLSEQPLATQHLPFVKTSPVWAQLEGLEILRTAPQRPNFHQFQQHGPEVCEGMALGLMTSFANLAESISRLHVLDGNGLLEQKMKGLALLEGHGFDVKDLRSRVETLIHANNRRVELQDSMRKVEEKIAHKDTEDRELGTHVRSLAMAVHCLELHAYLMRSAMRSAITQKMSNAMEISRLKTEAKDLERSYRSIAVPR